MAVGAADSSRFREEPDKFVGNRPVGGCWRMRQRCPLWSHACDCWRGVEGVVESEWPGLHYPC